MFLRIAQRHFLFGMLLFLASVLTATSALGSASSAIHAASAAVAAETFDSPTERDHHVASLGDDLTALHPDSDGTATLDYLDLEDNSPDDHFDVPQLFELNLRAFVGTRPIGKLPAATDAFIGRELRPPRAS